MKRANGTGSVVKLSGNRRKPWAVKVSARNQYGQVIQKNLSYHEKAAEAQAALEEYNRNLAAGTAPAVDKLSMTVGQIYDTWSAREYPKAGKSSIAAHTSAWKKRVSRYSSNKMRDMTIDHWQAILDEDEKNGLSQSLINNDVILIRALSKFSLKRDIIAKDYSQFLEIPTVSAKVEKGAFSEEQIEQLSKMAGDGVPWADTVLMLCYTGWRISEFLELKEESFHEENDGYLIGGKKTASGTNRIVPVHQKIRPYLMNWISKGGETIICKSNGMSISAAQYRDYFNVIVENLGIPQATPHWCRHTFATRLHRAKADPLTIKWLMGHSTASDITAHYTHETISELVAAISLLA